MLTAVKALKLLYAPTIAPTMGVVAIILVCATVDGLDPTAVNATNHHALPTALTTVCAEMEHAFATQDTLEKTANIYLVKATAKSMATAFEASVFANRVGLDLTVRCKAVSTTARFQMDFVEQMGCVSAEVASKVPHVVKGLAPRNVCMGRATM